MPLKPEKQVTSSKVERVGFPSVEHQFKPGQSGNPGGRVKGESITARLRRILDSEAKPGLPFAEQLAKAMVTEACKGKFPFAKEILDRLEGKVPDRIAGADGDALTITLRWDDAAGTYHQDALDAPGATGGTPPSGEV